MRKLKLSKEETYDEWKARNQESLKPPPSKKTKEKPWYIHPAFFSICGLCLIVVILIPVLVCYREPIKEYGETDLVLSFCDEELFSVINGFKVDEWQETEYKIGVIQQTQELGLTTVTGIYETEDFYAELMLTTVVVPNLKLSSKIAYDRCDKIYECGSFVFRYTQEDVTGIYTKYLACAEIEKKQYYLEIRTLWEIDVEAFLRTIFGDKVVKE